MGKEKGAWAMDLRLVVWLAWSCAIVCSQGTIPARLFNPQDPAELTANASLFVIGQDSLEEVQTLLENFGLWETFNWTSLFHFHEEQFLVRNLTDNLEQTVHQLRKVDGEDYKPSNSCICEPLVDLLKQTHPDLVVVISLKPNQTACEDRNHTKCLDPLAMTYNTTERMLYAERGDIPIPEKNTSIPSGYQYSFAWMLQYAYDFNDKIDPIRVPFVTEMLTPEDGEAWEVLMSHRKNVSRRINDRLEHYYDSLSRIKITDVTCYAVVRDQSKCQVYQNKSKSEQRKCEEVLPVDANGTVVCGKNQYCRLCSKEEETQTIQTTQTSTALFEPNQKGAEVSDPGGKTSESRGSKTLTSEATASLEPTAVGGTRPNQTQPSLSKGLDPKFNVGPTNTDVSQTKSSSGVSVWVIAVVAGIALLLLVIALVFVFIMRGKKKEEVKKEEQPESERNSILRTLSKESLKSNQASVGLGSSTRRPIQFESEGSQTSEPFSHIETPPLKPATETDTKETPSVSVERPGSGALEKKKTKDEKVVPQLVSDDGKPKPGTESPSSRTHGDSGDLQQEAKDPKDSAGEGVDTDGMTPETGESEDTEAKVA